MNKINHTGEGCKPIFDREEIKKATIKTNKIEERRTVVAIDKEQSASTNKSRTLRRRSLSLSSYDLRHRIDLKYQHNKTENCDIRKNDGGSSFEKRGEYKEKYTERGENKHYANRSRSRELHNSYSRPFMEEKSYRDRYRERSNERSHERRDRDSSRDRDRDRDRDRERERERKKERDRDRDRDRERQRKREKERDRDRDRDRNKDRDRSREGKDIAPHYIKSPIPVIKIPPIYYGSFPPRPIVASPMVPLRGQISPMGIGRLPALMAPVRPFPPRFPPDMYRLGHPPPNPREGCKPRFDREEIKNKSFYFRPNWPIETRLHDVSTEFRSLSSALEQEIKKATIKTNKVEEQRTVVAINKEQSVSSMDIYSEMLEVGLRVVRGQDWKWDDQDGGEGHAGTIVEIGRPPSTGNSTASPNPTDRKPDTTVIVQWDHGARNNYRIGYRGAYDLLVFDNAAAGVKHSNIICDGCKRHGIIGMRWKCTECFDYDLCTQCYMADVHELTHTFERYQTANFVGVRLGPREGCTKIPLKGIFIGAKVIRGPDWKWGNQDDGRGKTGRVMDIRMDENSRSVATVTWSTGSTNVYRLGFKGCVDLCYVEEANAVTYYKEHLPLLGQPVLTVPDNGNSTSPTKSGVASITSSPHPLTFKVGDKQVKRLMEIDTLIEMQDDHGGWNSRMAEYIGKIGTVHRITDKGDIRVQYEGCHNRWTFHPGALTKVTAKDAFSLGDIVRVKSDLAAVRQYQRGHGEWIDVMKNALGKTGKVIKIYSDGDLRVALDVHGHTWTFNPLSVVPVSSGTNATTAAHDNANRSRDRSMDGTDSEVEKLLRDAARGEAGVDAVREFLKKYPGRVDACAPGGGRKTCLQVAAHQGQRELCTLLLDAGASLRAVDEDGDTPLHYAAFGNQPEIMDLLLSRGAAINAVNNGRCSALHVAVNKQHVQCVRVLLRYHCDVNLQDSYGDTALHDAIGKDALDVIDALCACERIDFTLRNKRGFNILHHAALKGNAHATERLVARARQLVDVKKEDGFAALHLAALNGHREVAAILLSQNGGRAKVDLRNNRRQTPLHLATSQGHWSLVELLVHHNADIGSTDEDGDTVLHIAIAKSPNQQTAVPTPESSRDSPLIYAIWQNLARQGAKTELALACFLVSVDRSCKLLEQVRNNKDKTPLDLLEGNPQAALLADLLRSFKYQSHSTQLEIENPPTGYVEPPTYRIDNISQSEGLRGAKNIAGSGDAAECRDCSGIIADAKQENRFDPSSSVTLVGCARCGHTVVKTQAIQDGQLATGEVSIANPEDVPSEGKRKEEIGDREKEKDKDLERLRYLETRVADLEEANMCSICMERRRNVAFLCGHGACEHCAAPLKTCHMCRKTITKKINLY